MLQGHYAESYRTDLLSGSFSNQNLSPKHGIVVPLVRTLLVTYLLRIGSQSVTGSLTVCVCVWPSY